MVTNEYDPLLSSARRERALRWLRTDLKGYPTLSTEAETKATLATEPKAAQVKKGKAAAGAYVAVTLPPQPPTQPRVVAAA